MSEQQQNSPLVSEVLALAGLGRQKGMQTSMKEAVSGNHPAMGDLFPQYLGDPDNPRGQFVVVYRDNELVQRPEQLTEAQRQAVELVRHFVPSGEVRLTQTQISRILQQMRGEVQHYGCGGSTIPMTCTGPYCPLVQDAATMQSIKETGAGLPPEMRDLARCKCTLYETGVNPFGRPCQPPGTMVTTISGPVPIEQLDPEIHSLVSWDKKHRAIKKGPGGAAGYKFTLHQRDYADDLIQISAGDRQHEVTKSHISVARFNELAASKFCVYLMKQGKYWRVGKTKLMHTYNLKNGLKSAFGPGTRANKEGAEALWVLGVYDTNTEALLQEEFFSLATQTPQVCFADSLGKKESKHNGLYRWVTQEQIRAHMDRFVKPDSYYAEVLKTLGLDIAHPIWINGRKTELGEEQRFSLNHAFFIRACNLLPDVVDVPVTPEEPKLVQPGRNHYYVTEWRPISLSRRRYEGPVYSLDVHNEYKTYFANDIATHNCPLEILRDAVLRRSLYDSLEIEPADEAIHVHLISNLVGWMVLQQRILIEMGMDPRMMVESETNAVALGGEEGGFLVLKKKEANPLIFALDVCQKHVDSLRKQLIATPEAKARLKPRDQQVNAQPILTMKGKGRRELQEEVTFSTDELIAPGGES